MFLCPTEPCHSIEQCYDIREHELVQKDLTGMNQSLNFKGFFLSFFFSFLFFQEPFHPRWMELHRHHKVQAIWGEQELSHKRAHLIHPT